MKKKVSSRAFKLPDAVSTGGILCAVALTVAVILSSVNALTSERIAQAKQFKKNDAFSAIFPEAASFEPHSGVVLESVTNGYYVFNIYGRVIGYCFECSTSGFGGAIEMAVGVNPDFSVRAVKILSMSETPGLGAKADDTAFLGQFDGKSVPINLVKSSGEENDVNAITGATITSRAVVKGVENSIASAVLMSEQLPDSSDTEMEAENDE